MTVPVEVLQTSVVQALKSSTTLTVIVIVFDVAGLPVGQLILLVKIHVIWLPFVNALSV